MAMKQTDTVILMYFDRAAMYPLYRIRAESDRVWAVTVKLIKQGVK